MLFTRARAHRLDGRLGRPPPGQKSNFKHPSETRGDACRPICIFFTLLSSFAVLTRLYTRAFLKRRVGAEDCSHLLRCLLYEALAADCS